MSSVPTLYVEGKDDISVINALLLRHGVDTKRGKQFLCIKDQGDVDTLLVNMPEAIKAATDMPVGFVLDIDIEVSNRWAAVCGRLAQAGVDYLLHKKSCPESGFIGKRPEYPVSCGVWLMPDCKTDNLKLEDLCTTLIPPRDPLWTHARSCVDTAVHLADEAISNDPESFRNWQRFPDVDRVKADIHTWLAWQKEPGAALGASINARILSHDSPQAIALLRWLQSLFGLHQLKV